MIAGEHLTLSALQSQIKLSIDSTFPYPVWIVAEIGEMTINRNGHCYLELLETGSGTNNIIARCRATIWSYTFRMLKPYFETTSGQAFAEGLKVLIQAKPEYHELYGLSLNIRDIDPVYTLGEHARIRFEVIRRLTDDGIIDMNKELELPLVTQRIAIVSSPTAAGLQDFLEQLNNNSHKFVFYTKLFAAVMQGKEAVQSITDALDQIYLNENFFDVVVIIRGGGSQLDLACFDQYELASNIAQFPLPVITGIGHEKDDSVADMVAHTRLKTPTAVAEFIITGALSFSSHLNELEQHFVSLINENIENKNDVLLSLADEVNSLVNKRIAEEENKLNISKLNLNKNLNSYFKVKKNGIKEILVSTKNKTNTSITHIKFNLKQSTNKLNFVYKESINKSRNRINQNCNSLRIVTRDILKTEFRTCSMFDEKLRLVDPVNVLKRGFSISKINGRAVKSIQEIKSGDLMETVLNDGTVESRIEKTKG